MTKPVRISYWFIAATFVLVGVLHLGTPLLAALFSFFILERLHFVRNRWLAIGIFALILLAGSAALGRFTAQAVVALPEVAGKAIPSIIDYADRNGVQLPFTDWASFKDVALEKAKGQFQYVGRFATGATRELVFLIIGIVVAASLFLNSAVDLDRARHRIRNNLYSLTSEAIAGRFATFYRSFRTVMGAQLVISAINTALTAIFVLALRLPNAVVMIGVTFLCGLLPVVGNLISNTIIVAIAFTVSPQMALAALAFLIVIHKLEYVLNSKIIGDRIRNPVWLTLLALILGERLMGVPGMILAPVLLNYVKVEASAIEVEEEREVSTPRAEATPVVRRLPGAG
ncbi:MAG TPA: AI-2E family transporter [Thermoanaerobaculia bacterium]|jgi:predicted PurR-regulated permease PerM|nr:AI-2E family transporter [Thermoanaerobaculia bacterium]